MSEDQAKRENMASELVKQADTLREELMELEKQFNVKKEQFLRIQGALEALNMLGTSIPQQESSSANEG